MRIRKPLHDFRSRFLAALGVSAAVTDIAPRVHATIREHLPQIARHLKSRSVLYWFSNWPLEQFAWENCKTDFESLSRSLSDREHEDAEALIRSVEYAVWDMIVYDQGWVCPQCAADTLQCLSRWIGDRIYLSCPSCFWTRSESGTVASLTNDLVPARKPLLETKGFMPRAKPE